MTLATKAPAHSGASHPISNSRRRSPTQEPPPKRRWYQFSLRSLLAVMTLFVFLLAAYWAVFRTYVEPYRVQREAAKEVQEKWLELEIVWEPAGPKWMRDVFGEEHFRNVVEIRWSWHGGYRIIDSDDFARLKSFSNLRDLAIVAEEVSKDGLAHLSELTQLETLVIACPQIADQDLVHLHDLTELRSLGLEYTSITGEGLSYLTKLKSLEKLSLRGSKSITGEGWSYLTKLKNLKKLSLEGSQINDESSHYLSQLEDLEELSLNSTYITDESLRHLDGLTNLKRLDVAWTRISFGGFLDKLPGLETLVLSGWAFPNQETLRPNLKIEWIPLPGY